MSSRSKVGAVLDAVFTGDLAAVRRVIAQGNDANALDRDGRTPLFQAVVDGNLAIAAELIKNGADVNAQDRDLERASKSAGRKAPTIPMRFSSRSRAPSHR